MRSKMGRHIYMCKTPVSSAWYHSIIFHIMLTHELYSIVGKGNHSANHIQKIKPRVEQICQQLGLQYSTEQNEGRIYINLQGGPAIMPSYPQPPNQQHHGGYQSQQQQQGYGGQQQGYQGGQQQYVGQQQQGNNDEVEKIVIKLLPRIFQKLGCCVVM